MYTLTTMNDPRWDKLAKVFCSSTSIKPGDKVLLQVVDLDALPLLFALQRKALEAGAASVDYQIVLPDLERNFFERATDVQLDFLPEWSMAQMKEMDVFIAARACANGLNLKEIKTEKVARRTRVTRPVVDERVANTRWCVTRVPTDHDAILAGMSTPAYIDYYFSAVLQDYKALKRKNLALKKLMERTNSVHIQALGTDLKFSIKNINVVSCHGESNIPDGEVFTAPIRDSVKGVINYNVSSLYQGREWSNICFEFSKGKIVGCSCDQGEAELEKVLDTDEGSRFIGEFAIGTNIGIRRAAKNTLFDEKIFGSFHLTPGSAYDDADNGNKSAVHWDLVKILTPEFGGGFIKFDGAMIMEDGKFVHPELLALNG